MNTKYLIIGLIVIAVIAFILKGGELFKSSSPVINVSGGAGGSGSPVGGSANPYADQSQKPSTNLAGSLLSGLTTTLTDLITKATTSTTHTGGNVPPVVVSQTPIISSPNNTTTSLIPNEVQKPSVIAATDKGGFSAPIIKDLPANLPPVTIQPIVNKPIVSNPIDIPLKTFPVPERIINTLPYVPPKIAFANGGFQPKAFI